MSERFPGIDWYCDRCNAYLNDQPGFDDHHYVWKILKEEIITKQPSRPIKVERVSCV